ncbi:MAG: alpha/beta hydrolase [Candidatus Thorarchaeota archaeon]
MVSEILEFLSGDTPLRGVLSQGQTRLDKGALILHPHPLYGGDMHNPVVTALEHVLLDAGYTTLRFDFRGTSTSPQGYSGIDSAIIDASNAMKLLLSRGVRECGVAGYSFGGSTAIRSAIGPLPLFLITLSASFGLIAEGNFDTTQLTRITCPTLMFHGLADRMVPHADIETLSKFIGSQELETVSIEEEGHFYNRSIEIVKNRTRRFLGKINTIDRT